MSLTLFSIIKVTVAKHVINFARTLQIKLEAPRSVIRPQSSTAGLQMALALVRLGNLLVIAYDVNLFHVSVFRKNPFT